MNTAKTKAFFQLFQDRIFDGAASLSFYLIFAIFPGVIAALSVLSLFAPYEILMEIQHVWSRQIPFNLRKIFIEVIRDVASEENLKFFSVGFLVALWTSTSGVMAMMRQINLAYDVKETRGIIKQRFVALILAISFAIVFVVSFLLLVFGKILVESFLVNTGLIDQQTFVITSLRLMSVELVLLTIFSLVYYYGPNVRQSFKFITVGSVVCSLLFLVSTQLFSYYLANLANYSATYGSIGAVIALLLWLYIFGFLLVLGAELNQWVKNGYVSKNT